jgi:hypothetical protein
MDRGKRFTLVTASSMSLTSQLRPTKPLAPIDATADIEYDALSSEEG